MTILYFIIALGLLVTIHEAGHLIMAKRGGIKVEAFSIGFGPKLFAFQYGGTEYKVCIIPLGGYVKMIGENPEEEGAKEKDSYAMQSIWTRLKVVVAGPLMNILLCIVIMPLVFLIGRMEPTYLGKTPVVEQVRQGSPAAKSGVQVGDTIMSVGDVSVATWRDAIDQVLISGGKPVDVLVFRNNSQQTIEVTPAAMPQMRGFYIGVEPFFYIDNDPIIDKVVSDSPASRAGLESLDRIIAMNGQAIETWTDMTEVIGAAKGKTVLVDVKRAGAVVSLEVTPEFNNDLKTWVVGVQKNMNPSAMAMEKVSYGLTDSLVKGWQEVKRLTTLTLGVLKRLVTFQLSYKNLGGPIQIAQASAMAAQNGFADFIHFLGFLSLQLGMLNLLPIPVLDGGHVVFLGIEAIRRKPLSIKAQGIIQQVGLVLLLTLFLMVTINDLENVWGLKSLVMSWF